MSSYETTITLIGAGRMGMSLLQGWLNKKAPNWIINVVEPNPTETLKKLFQDQRVAIYTKIEDCPHTKIWVVAVKPQTWPNLKAQLKTLTPSNLLISIMAGVTCEDLAEAGANNTVRTMPNTPASVGAGVTIGVTTKALEPQQKELTEQLMSVTGSYQWIQEEGLMDTITAVSGSGPAYVFAFVEALAHAAERAGLSKEQAAWIARQTVIGGAELLKQSSDTPETLRQNVTSPGGTTAAGLNILLEPNSGLFPLIEHTVSAAQKRSSELGKTNKK